MISIPREEFVHRIDQLQDSMRQNSLDGIMVYGDEYRKEHLRYVSNAWPIFERGACFIPRDGEPILGGAPEGEQYAREMSVWDDVRNIKELAPASVPEEIDYRLANFATLADVIAETVDGGRRLGLIGSNDIPAQVLRRVEDSVDGLDVVPADDLLTEQRIIKSEAEVACLREAGRLACIGYRELIAASVPGSTELVMAGAAEGAARSAGAEDINFSVIGTGPRTATIVGRPVSRVVEEGDMVMAAIAVQYQGYVSTAEFPFVSGRANDQQRRFLEVLFEAANVQLEYLKEGVTSGEMVRAVQAVFARRDVSQYDVYPPMHGIGLAEAESPYPDRNSEYLLRAGMCVNSDISLFGHPAGSNRIEEGFVIGTDGPETITPYVRELCENGLLSTEELLSA